MILVNIFFRELNQSYDFQLDEQAPIYRLTDEMVDLIVQNEHITLNQDSSPFLLCSPSAQRTLDGLTSLAENHVVPGDTLLLV